MVGFVVVATLEASRHNRTRSRTQLGVLLEELNYLIHQLEVIVGALESLLEGACAELSRLFVQTDRPLPCLYATLVVGLGVFGNGMDAQQLAFGGNALALDSTPLGFPGQHVAVPVGFVGPFGSTYQKRRQDGYANQ